jgi:hypothetical protein
MATTYKVLGQVNPPATTVTPVYTVPSSTSAIISTISVCNQAATPATFRIAVQPAGITIAAKHYINYDTVIAANDTIFLTLGITLATTDVISIYTSSTTVSVSVFGTELS